MAAVPVREWRIAAEGHELVVAEIGGGLRRYAVDGLDVIDGYAEGQAAPAGAGQHLVPWPNRIRDGRYRFADHVQQLPLTEPSKQNASHGLLRWVAWRPENVTAHSLTMTCTVNPQPGYHHMIEVRVHYEVGPDGLVVEPSATNLGPTPAPFGYGAHPYVFIPGVPIHFCLLEFGAGTRLVSDERSLPIGREPVAGTEYDFSTPRMLEELELDTPFTDLTRDGERRATFRLSTEDGSGVEVWMDEAFEWMQVFTADSLPKPRRRRSIAVEPMTCPPDAFNSGEDLIVLEPEQTWRGRWGIRPLSR
jgi:aldose 1-epimerase